jgi:predicted dehydrogenase
VSTALRWGLLGTALINRRLIPAMRAARRSQLSAVASRDGGRATGYAREWGIATAHASYDALLRDRSVDAIYVSLPNSLHVEWTLRALDAGKHVLCEKPLALTPGDVDRVAAVAHARSLVVAEAFMYRHEPLIAKVLELVRGGAIGRPWLITSGFSFIQSRVPDVRLDPALGGGSLWDIGCYAVSVARLVAEREPAAAFGLATMTESGVDDAFSGVLHFSGGLVAAVHSSFRAEYRTWLEIAGADGVMRVENPFRPRQREAIVIQRGNETSGVETSSIDVSGSPELFVRQVEDFVAAALDGRPQAVSLAETRGNAAALVALYASAATGCTVAI